jgi:replicative DNA helicase
MNDRPQPMRPEVPSDVEGEKSILATIFHSPDSFDTVMERIAPDDFFSGVNRQIYELMIALAVENTVISKHSVAERLKQEGLLEAVGGVSYLSDLSEFQATAAGLEFTVDNVRSKGVQRKLVHLAEGIVQDGMGGRVRVDELLQSADKGLTDLLQERYARTSLKLGEIITEVYKDIKERMTSGESTLGIKTGFVDLDEKMSGMHNSNLIIVAARPSMGKTALALNIASNAALKHEANVVVFSLEMSKQELAFRLLASEAQIDAKRLREGRVTPREMDSFTQGVQRLTGAKIVVDDTPALNILEMRARARRLHKEGLCDVIIIDYLQMIHGTGNTQSREQEIAEISRMLKAIAKELNVPVVALSQLNRGLESRQNKRPLLSDLRESGAIEQDADVIIFIYRDEYYDKQSKDKGIAELIIGKQRNGPVGTVKVGFRPDLTRFANLALDPESISI